MDFDYSTYFGTEHSTGYERLLRDCMAGDATLFQRADMVEAGWNVIQPILGRVACVAGTGLPELPSGLVGTDRGRRFASNAMGANGRRSAKKKWTSAAAGGRKTPRGDYT